MSFVFLQLELEGLGDTPYYSLLPRGKRHVPLGL
jgi:hypothetical protein